MRARPVHVCLGSRVRAPSGALVFRPEVVPRLEVLLDGPLAILDATIADHVHRVTSILCHALALGFVGVLGLQDFPALLVRDQRRIGGHLGRFRLTLGRGDVLDPLLRKIGLGRALADPVPLPLFDRNQGNLLEALKREDKARDELQALNIRVSTDVLQARERLESIRREVDVLQQDVLPGAKSAYDAATVGFENGKFNFLEVLDAQRTYFAAKSQYLKALAEAHRTAADIDRVLGESGANATQPANKE